MLEYLTVLLVIIFVVFFFFFLSENKQATINERVRENNSCEVKRKIEMNDPQTGIHYNVIFTSDTCEDGLPHTTDKETIVIPESYPESRLKMTIDHEKIHLLQRRYPLVWETWYEKMWSYRISRTPPAGMPLELLERRRINPDIEEKSFAEWKGWWSLAAFRSEYPSSLKDAETVWWNEKTGEQRKTPPPEWLTFFAGKEGSPAQDEHPHEMAAQMIANGTGNKNRIIELVKVYEHHFVKNRTEE